MIIPKPKNETVKSYKQNSEDFKGLLEAIEIIRSNPIEVPLIIGNSEVKTGTSDKIIEPHNHSNVLGKYYLAGEKEIDSAVEEANKAWQEWSAFPYQHRAAIFLKAAELLSTKYRHLFNAALMLNLSKNIYQAEIDTAELIDFWRFNPYYMEQIWRKHSLISPQGEWNYLDPRPLEGFVFAITPFNFASIAGNLPTAPAMFGNTVIWKPASSAIYPAYLIMKILKESGLPDGVINLLPGSGAKIGENVLTRKELSGVHFTGSTNVFNQIWQTIGKNIAHYTGYPRIVGETGGKDFIFAHNSAEIDSLVTATIRGAFEYQGQKCSAASRMYVPESIWEEFSQRLVSNLRLVKMGVPDNFDCLVNSVIDQKSFRKITGIIEEAKKEEKIEFIYGGSYDDSEGYFIEPTIIKTENPQSQTMREEIFGPVMTIYVYPDREYTETLQLCDRTSEYALTGCIFATKQEAIIEAEKLLRHSAGNFYINDKPTGAVVGQQPFGGARKSGTNDKAGSLTNLMRWVSLRSIKVNFNPATDFHYPFMD